MAVRGSAANPLYQREDNPEAAFDLVDPARAEEDLATFAAQVEAVRLAVADRSLDETFVFGRENKLCDLRWMFVHMIEEYARHNGHADLLREMVDGVTGS